MTTFDQILPAAIEVCRQHEAGLPAIGEMIINRDLNGRVRLIVPEAIEDNPAAVETVHAIAAALADQLA